MKALLAAAAAIVAAPVVLVVIVLGGGSKSAAALGPQLCAVPGVSGNSKAPGAPGASVGDVKLDAEQVRNIRTMLGVAKSRGLGERAGVITVATSRQESTWRNLDHGDRDSLGLFQQRPSQGWGAPAQLMDPVYATGKFLDRLATVPKTLSIEVMAQKVQISGDGALYRQWIPIATAVTAAFWPGAPAVKCTGGGAGIAPSKQAETALARAGAMLGKPYCWVGGNGSGPTHGTGGSGCDGRTVGFDCSGLVLYAWSPFAKLPHFTGDQAQAGRKVPLADAKPGDLVFLSNPDAGNHHVAMIWSAKGDATGSGEIVEAADFNVPVHIRPWRGVTEPEAMSFAVRLAG